MSANDSGVNVFAVQGLGENTLDRVTKILAGIPKASSKALNSAILRTATSGTAYAAKVLCRDYHIKAHTFKFYTESKRHVNTSGGHTSVDIEFRGRHIPLKSFDTKVGSDGRVVTRVKRSSAQTVLEHAFRVEVGQHGHAGIFERVGPDRLPIEEKFGPSTPQMMAYNKDIAREIGEHVKETFDKRIEHEMLAILNGWRTV